MYNMYNLALVYYYLLDVSTVIINSHVKLFFSNHDGPLVHNFFSFAVVFCGKCADYELTSSVLFAKQIGQSVEH